MSLIVSEVYDALLEAGASEAKAKAAAGAIPLAEHLTTKEDLAEVKAELKDDIASVKAELKDDIAGVKAEIAEVRTELAEVKAELKTDIAGVKTEMAGLEARFYRQLWIMAAGIVGLTVTLIKLLD